MRDNPSRCDSGQQHTCYRWEQWLYTPLPLALGLLLVLSPSKTFTHLVMFIAVRNSVYGRIKEKAIVNLMCYINAHPYLPWPYLILWFKFHELANYFTFVLCSWKKMFLKKALTSISLTFKVYSFTAKSKTPIHKQHKITVRRAMYPVDWEYWIKIC